MRIKIILGVILGAMTLGLMSGCATKTEEENDLPWATQKSWENTLLPGVAPQYNERRDY